MTENHSLSTPPRGFQDWDEPLNDNFTSIDTKLPVVDLETNTGNYTPKEDAVFISSDTGAIFRGDGSSWNELPDSGPISLADDEAITFGSDDDYSIEYDSSNDLLQIRDEGASNDAITIDSSQNVSVVNGSLTVSGGTTDVNGNDLEDSGTTIWDTSVGEVPDSALGSIDNATLTNSSITVTAGSHLSGGGSISLGSSATINVDDDFVLNTGDSITGNLNFANSDSIQAAGSDIISFPGSGNVELASLGASFEITVDSSFGTGDDEKDSGITFTDANGQGDIAWVADVNDDEALRVADTGLGANVLIANSSGSVDFPSGDLQSGDSNSALELDERTSVTDTDAVALSRDSAAQGYAMIQDVTNNVSTMVYLGGSTNSVEIIHDSGSGNNFTTTEGNDGTTNVYWDSTNSRYELNNETGGSATYAVEILKA